MPGLLAGLDALAVALVLLAATYAISTVFRPLLVGVLSQAPFVGGWLASNVDNGLGAFQSAINTPLNNSLYLVSSSLDWVANNGRDFLQSLKDLAGAALWTSWVIATVTIPQAVSNSEATVSAWVDAAKAWALAQVQALEVRLQAEVGMVAATAAADVLQARSDLGAAVSKAEADAAGAVAAVETEAQGLFRQAEYDASQFAAHAQQVASDLVTQARADLGAAVGAVEHDLGALAEAERVALSDSVSVLGGDIAAAEARASAALSEAEKGVKAEIESVLNSGPWAGLVQAYEGGEAALAANVEALVRASIGELRKELADAGTIRAKYQPQIQAVLANLRRGA